MIKSLDLESFEFSPQWLVHFTPCSYKCWLSIYIFLCILGLYDTVFDVDHDKERAKAQGLEPNGFNFDGADPAGVDYALNRWAVFVLSDRFFVHCCLTITHKTICHWLLWYWMTTFLNQPHRNFHTFLTLYQNMLSKAETLLISLSYLTGQSLLGMRAEIGSTPCARQ